MDDAQRKLTENQGRNEGRSSIASAIGRELRLRYSEASDDDLAHLAAKLHAQGALSWDSTGKLRVFDVAFVESHAPRLLALNGEIVGNSDASKLGRARRRELELEPLKTAPLVRTTGRSLTDALTAVAQMPARTDAERCARALARERTLEAYEVDGPGDAA